MYAVERAMVRARACGREGEVEGIRENNGGEDITVREWGRENEGEDIMARA